ncbi:MAG TPA: hypothetical protein VHA57_13990, partial [Actinomycetota bacterium]|nr:hypothetical protein [Actinomycetota bacterium]
MWYSAPDNQRSIRRFHQARKSLAKGRRHRGQAQPSSASADRSTVTVMSTARRPRGQRVIDLRDEDPGPVRWPADGWTLGSAASSGRMNWADDLEETFTPPEVPSARASGTAVWQTPAAVSAAAARTGELR